MRNRTAAALLCGLLGCLCFGAGDWLMPSLCAAAFLREDGRVWYPTVSC